MNSHTTSHLTQAGATFASAMILPRVREIRAANPNFDDYANALASFADEQFGQIGDSVVRADGGDASWVEMLAQFESRISALEQRIQNLESGQ